MPEVKGFIPAPHLGFRDDFLGEGPLLQASRNVMARGDHYVRRPGYIIRRKNTATPATASYLERIQLDEASGTRHNILHYQDDFVQDVDAMTAVESAVYDPLAAPATTYHPSWAHLLGRTVWVANGDATKFRILIHDGSSYLSKPSLDDPATVVPTVAAGGSMTQVQWFIRGRWYDEDTGTYSAPWERTITTTATVTLSGGNSSITVPRPAAPPTRCSHWQLQCAQLVDTPGSYEITYEPGDSIGRIPKATVTVTLTADPASGARFAFRTIGASTIYRHTNPPPAHFVTEWRRRVFFAAANNDWLVWSESDNPEYFYHDTTDPHLGFNTLDGESLVQGVTGPCTGLSATQNNLLFFMERSIVMGEGSWALVGEQRMGRMTPVVQNSAGAISGSTAIRDHLVFYASAEGPKMLVNGYPSGRMDARAVRHAWALRDPEYDHRIRIAYDPHWDVVICAFVSRNAPITGVADLALVFHVSSGTWCGLWDVSLTSMTLGHLTTDASEDRGVRLMWSMPYGTIGEFGAGSGDGWDGSSAGANEDTSDVDTATSIDKTGAGWTPDEHVGKSIVLEDPITGNVFTRFIKDNDADTITWDGSATNSGGDWNFAIGGIHGQKHLAQPGAAGGELTLNRVIVVLDDQLSRRT